MFDNPLPEQQLSATVLTEAEASGGVCPSFFGGRRHRVPHDWPTAVSRFLNPFTPETPRPSPSRPYLRSGPSQAAA